VCISKIFSDTKKISMLESHQQEVCNLCGCHFLWKYTLLFSVSEFHCNSCDDSCYFSYTTRRLTSTPSLSTIQENYNWYWQLSPHQSIAFTRVFELLITLWKGSHFCTQYIIAKVLSFSNLSLTYLSFVITLFSMPLAKSYRDNMLDPEWKSAMMKRRLLCMLMKHEN